MQNNQEYQFVEDNDGHWYIIPTGLYEKFYNILNNEIDDDLETAFEQYRIGCHPNQIYFKEYRFKK